MDVTELSPVSWYRITLEHEVDLKQALIDWARENDVSLAWVQGIGEIRNPTVATGYEDNDDPRSEKFIQSSSDNHHAVGIGTIIRDQDGERVHMHGPVGRDGETTTGCWAQNPETFRGMDLLITVLEKED